MIGDGKSIASARILQFAAPSACCLLAVAPHQGSAGAILIAVILSASALWLSHKVGRQGLYELGRLLLLSLALGLIMAATKLLPPAVEDPARIFLVFPMLVLAFFAFRLAWRSCGYSQPRSN